MRRSRGNPEKIIRPQDVYGTVDATCRECRHCFDTGLPGVSAHYCHRFLGNNDPRARINAYDQACGKFERREQA